jgi:hypothetical protein
MATTQKFHIGSHIVRVEVASDRVKFFAEGPSGDGRFLEMGDGGGTISLTCPGNITTGTGLELDEGGHAIFHLE